MKLKLRQTIFLLFALLWMGLIFWFSARTGVESSAQSGGIVDTIIRLFFSSIYEASPAKQDALIHILTLLIRKGCHAAEYCVLGLLLLGTQSWKYPLKRTALTAWILTVCYAITDEIHQYFVPERACMVRDVLIDSTGAAVGILILVFFYLLHYKKTTA